MDAPPQYCRQSDMRSTASCMRMRQQPRGNRGTASDDDNPNGRPPYVYFQTMARGTSKSHLSFVSRICIGEWYLHLVAVKLSSHPWVAGVIHWLLPCGSGLSSIAQPDATECHTAILACFLLPSLNIRVLVLVDRRRSEVQHSDAATWVR